MTSSALVVSKHILCKLTVWAVSPANTKPAGFLHTNCSKDSSTGVKSTGRCSVSEPWTCVVRKQTIE